MRICFTWSCQDRRLKRLLKSSLLCKSLSQRLSTTVIAFFLKGRNLFSKSKLYSHCNLFSVIYEKLRNLEGKTHRFIWILIFSTFRSLADLCSASLELIPLQRNKRNQGDLIATEAFLFSRHINKYILDFWRDKRVRSSINNWRAKV